MGIKVDVMSYLYNRMSVIDEEYLAKSAFMRYHRVDEVDYMEMIIAKARKDLMNEISHPYSPNDGFRMKCSRIVTRPPFLYYYLSAYVRLLTA